MDVHHEVGKTKRIDTTLIQADFDRLALLSTQGWDHTSHYHRWLVQQVPQPCRTVLEVGCDTGAFARLLAPQVEQILALDLSPQMIHLAQARSARYDNIAFQVADVSFWAFPAEHFDCIVSIATLHHLPLEEMLSKMKRALRVNVVLLVLDVYQPRLADALPLLVAIPTNLVLHVLKTGRFREPPAVRAAWAEHARHDVYLPLAQLRSRCLAILPGAQLRKLLLWRYSLVRKKTGTLTEGEVLD